MDHDDARLCRAILDLNVGHDLDIESATRSVSSLPGNVRLTSSDGLLTGYKVACQFESHPLQRKVTNACRFAQMQTDRL
jgi:hypothetical protein